MPAVAKNQSNRSSIEEQTDDVAMNIDNIAFENYHTQVFHAWLNFDREKRLRALEERYIFFSICHEVGPHLNALLKVDTEKAKLFAEEIRDAAALLAQEKKNFTEEWFRGLDHLVAALSDHNYLPEARKIVTIGFKTGVVKFPRIAQSLNVHAAYLDALAGRRDKASKIALHLVRRPYLLPNRRELPKLYQKLMYILSASNHLPEYKEVIWKGASSYHAHGQLRGVFVGQIVKTYRGAFRAMLHVEVPLVYRLPFVLGNIDRVLTDTPWISWTRAYIPVRWWHTACLYLLAYINVPFRAIPNHTDTPSPSISLKKPRRRFKLRRTRKILVTRAMGGIGDVLMMTPGLKALTLHYPKAQIDFALPKPFHSLLDGFSGIHLLDINEDEINIGSYRRWINLTDCPAGKMESLQYPNVKRNRIEIFAHAMGISRLKLRRTSGFLPVYYVSQEEEQWAKHYLQAVNPQQLPVIGIQPFAADTYRNWPYMEHLVQELTKTHLVLVFHHEEMHGYNFPNTIKIIKPLRQSIALVAQCHRLVVLDSSFLHFSAALKIPTIAVFGAISGKLRTKNYPNVRLITPQKAEFPCYPCWRHEHKPCHLTNGRESICFRSIAVRQVMDALAGDLAHWQIKKGILKRFKNWIFYGSE